MSLARRIAPHLPHLRRFARAATGNQGAGDALVGDLLENLITEPQRFNLDASVKPEAFRLLCQILAEKGKTSRPSMNAAPWEIETANRLQWVPICHRLAFLLSSVERFSMPEISHILGEPVQEIEQYLDDFADELANELATDVLIIEDEPLIAMDIDELVRKLGHRVSGMARTHTEALASVAKSRPGLILADIQLADGSSGIEAVNQILATFDLPVIFITAYPERLLTGIRPEPAFLVAKPYRAEVVRALISQALFFNEKAHPAGKRPQRSIQASIAP